MDPYVPLVTIDENEKITIEGIGIFKDDQLKLQLDSNQTALFSLLDDYRSQATIKVDFGKENSRDIIIVNAFRSKSNWNWDQKQNQLHLRLQLKMTISQYPGKFNLDKEKDINGMKKIITNNIEKGIKNLLATFKENEVDPLGIGNIVRSKDRTWQEESFYKEYPTLPIHINTDVQIIHTGLES